MSLQKTKERLVHLLGQDNSVIALSGKWGTGKTHLWNEVKEASDDEKVKKALYVSLFGLSSVDQIKRKLIESAIPGVDSHGGVFDGIKNLFNTSVTVASQHYKAMAALKDLNVLSRSWASSTTIPSSSACFPGGGVLDRVQADTIEVRGCA